MKLIKKSPDYKWEFEKIGGTTRIKITKGEDIVKLPELDRKMWTVLSCPVKGLEIDDKSLAYIDTDADGRIHLDDVVRTSQWITGAIKNPDALLSGGDSFKIDDFNIDNPTGKKLYNSAKCILDYLGKESDCISLADLADSTAIFSQTKLNGDGVITEISTEDPQEKEAIKAAIAMVGSVKDRSGLEGINAELIKKFYDCLQSFSDWNAAKTEAPFQDKTEAVLEAYNALNGKVKDFFMRSHLAAYAPDCATSLDVQKVRIEAISAEDLAAKTDEIASYPIARINAEAQIALDGPINPVWESKFRLIAETAFDKGQKYITEKDWAELNSKLAAYTAWKSAKAGAEVEKLGLEKVNTLLKEDKKTSLLELVANDLALKEESENIDLIDKFLHIYRDFYKLLKNFVSFQDFYDPDKKKKAIFQAGDLIIDQRACHFCMDVADAAKHGTMAAASGMYLVYCDCTTKTKPGVRKIVAAVTVGDVGDLAVGKNAIFYDNSGLDWDAVITKIIENPISIAQAFWSPYRRLAKTVENFINKSAADKDAKLMAEASKKITTAPKLPTDGAATATPPFDIAKFAGIFAAIGMAIGAIGTFLASLVSGFAKMNCWQLIAAIAGIMLLISGPSMIMAWLKLRRRNISPLLNANGWAINASSNISIQFGATLTDTAKFPKLKLKDPYAKKGIPCWAKWLITFGTVAIIVVTLWLFNLLSWAKLPSPLPMFNEDKTEEVTTITETETTVTETTVIENEIIKK